MITAHGKQLRTLSPLLLLGLVALSSCRNDEPKFEILTLEGKIEKIDLVTPETGSITVVYYNEKQEQDVAGTGLVTKDTEIVIDGAISKLADLNLGERVRGEVRMEKTDRTRTLIALKIYVERAKPIGD